MKKARQDLRPRLTGFKHAKFRSEADLGAEGYPPVVFGTVVKDHFITNLSSQPEGAQERFHPAAWIEDAAYVIVPKIRYAAGKCGK